MPYTHTLVFFLAVVDAALNTYQLCLLLLLPLLLVSSWVVGVYGWCVSLEVLPGEILPTCDKEFDQVERENILNKREILFFYR